jgi:hypothetical protein
LYWQSTVWRHVASAMHVMIAEQHCASSQLEHTVQPAHATASSESVQLVPLLPLLLATAPQMGARGPPLLLPLPLLLPPPLEVLPPLSAGLPLSPPMPLDEPPVPLDEPLVLPDAAPLVLPDAAPLLVPDVLPLEEPPAVPEPLPLLPPLPVPLLLPLPLEEPLMRGLRFPASCGVGSS